REDVRGLADASLRQELAGREREELAVARGDGGAEQPEPEREAGDQAGLAGNRRVQEPARGDLGERQDHDPRQREAGEAVLELDRERFHAGEMCVSESARLRARGWRVAGARRRRSTAYPRAQPRTARAPAGCHATGPAWAPAPC